MSEFSLYLPISKIDTEKRMVWGYASTPTKDLQGEIVKVSAIKNALPDYMQWANIREMHQPSAVGITTEHNISEKGLYIGAKIVDEPAWQKCKEKVYKGFSIGGNTIEKVGDTITALQLIEISLVDRPANPTCKFDTVKGMAEVSVGELDIEADEPSRNTLISKFLDMGAKLLGIEKAAPVVVEPAVVIPPVVIPKEESEIEENTMKLEDIQALAKKHNLTAQEVAKRLGKNKAMHMDKAMSNLHKAQAEHDKCYKALGKAIGVGNNLVTVFVEKGLMKKEDAESLVGHLNKMGDAHDMCEHHMGKAMGSHVSQGGMAPIDSEFDESGDVKAKPQSALTEGEVDELSMFAVDSPYSEAERHKGAQVNKAEMTALVAEALKPFQDKIHALEIENATMKGTQLALASMPGNGRRAPLFALDKSAVVTQLGSGSSNPADSVNNEIAKAYSTIDPQDPDSCTRGVARIIGLRAANPQLFGKPITDPSFKGGAGR